ncbi:hypothetical protein KUCAC02_001595, partial [Chaenocephalus aceratus]
MSFISGLRSNGLRAAARVRMLQRVVISPHRCVSSSHEFGYLRLPGVVHDSQRAVATEPNLNIALFSGHSRQAGLQAEEDGAHPQRGIDSSLTNDMENRRRPRTNSQSDPIRRGRGRPKTVGLKKPEDDK